MQRSKVDNETNQLAVEEVNRALKKTSDDILEILFKKLEVPIEIDRFGDVESLAKAIESLSDGLGYFSKDEIFEQLNRNSFESTLFFIYCIEISKKLRREESDNSKVDFIYTMGCIPDPRINELIEVIKNNSGEDAEQASVMAASTIVNFGSQAVKPLVETLFQLNDSHDEIILQALADIGDISAFESLIKYISGKDNYGLYVSEAFFVLRAITGKDFDNKIKLWETWWENKINKNLNILQEKGDKNKRAISAHRLSCTSRKDVIISLINVITCETGLVATNAWSSLKKITGLHLYQDGADWQEWYNKCELNL